MFKRTPDDSAFIYADPMIEEWRESPLWWHMRGRQQTASGYGKRLKTSNVVRIGTVWHRVYCVCYSNCGTCYIERKGECFIVSESFPEMGLTALGVKLANAPSALARTVARDAISAINGV